jgi:ABC-2 type transport system ATP-binding protein
MTERAVVAASLLKRYGSVTALRDTSFEVRRGSITGFVGRNGAGKTTTLKIVSTLLRADDGRCEVFGVDARHAPHEIRRRIGFLPDSFELPPSLTLHEYLDVFAELYGIGRGDRTKRVNTALQLTRSEDLGERRLNALSRGEQQRAGLARALIHNPDLLLLDEPAAGLDPHARVELKDLLRLLRERGKTVFLSSHVLADLEEICDDLVVIRNGSVVFSGDVAAFRRDMKAMTRWRLSTAGGQLTLPTTLPGEVVATGPNFVEIEGDLTAADRARLIAELVARGVAVSELSPQRTTLEQEFAKAVDDEEDIPA